MKEEHGDGAPFERPLLWAILALGLAVGAARVYGIFTENVNWDEFFLLQRAEVLARTGELRGSGRPGLANYVLAPFAEGCRNAVDALVSARVLWTAFVAGSIAAFWILLRAALSRGDHRRLAVATGVGLWVLSPAFLRYSVQVRTDQLAVLGGLWGGVLLVWSARRPWLALPAGIAMALGFLASQKLVYVLGVVAILVLAWHEAAREVNWRREGLRLGLCLLGAALTTLGFYGFAATAGGTTSDLAPVAAQLQQFAFYRQFVWYWWYIWMWPSLIAQTLSAVALLVVTVDWLKRRGRHGGSILAAWTMLLAGVVVVIFHAGRFPYFMIVLGLFPAAVGALALNALLDRLGSAKQRVAVLAAFWMPLAGWAVYESMGMIGNDLRHQRESLAFVEASFPAGERGFSGLSVFACRHDEDPFPIRFANRLQAEFVGEEGEQRTGRLLQEFRGRPVAFLLRPLRGYLYPDAVQAFWASHYVDYFRQIQIPGRRVDARPSASQGFEPVVAGAYRWWPDDGAAGLRVEGRHLHPGESIDLAAAKVVTLTPTDSAGGVFALEVDAAPRPDTSQFFTLFLERRDRIEF